MGLPRDADDVEAIDPTLQLDEWIVAVRRALVARYGVEVGAEAAAEVAAWAAEHGHRLTSMANPAGYLYRVGQTAASKAVRWGRRHVRFPTEPLEPTAVDAPPFDADLFRALEQLRDEHRTAVLLVHGYGFTYREVAELLDVSEAAVTNFVHRGTARLRTILGEDPT